MNQFSKPLSICAALAISGTVMAKPTRTPQHGQHKFGEVKLTGTAKTTSETQTALKKAVVESWSRYQHQDSQGFLALLCPDVTRMTKRAGLQHGAQQVARELKDEWSAYERQARGLSENLELSNVQIQLDSEKSPHSALVSYWIESSGGGRWDYSDQGLVLQVWQQLDGKWKLAHHSESLSLSYDLANKRPGRPTMEFDYVYPVKDMARAIKFYRPILGEPESVSNDRTSFNMGGPRMILQLRPLGGISQAGSGLANGFAIFRTANLEGRSQALRQGGCKFLLGTDSKFRQEGADPAIVIQDPSGNAVVVGQAVYRSDFSKKPVIKGFANKDPFVQLSSGLAKAWMNTSTDQLAQLLTAKSRWFDDSRSRIHGQQVGKDTILKDLPRIYWNHYDRGPAGLQAQLSTSSLKVRPFGTGAVVSYQAELTGTGAHSLKETSYVTDVFDSNHQLLQHFSTTAPSLGGLALEMDYTGYPVLNLKTTRRFYSDLLRLGKPYGDSDYLGWWSNFAVFGAYLANLEDDRMPRPGRANGYVSFWVKSASSAYHYAKGQGRRFPIIPAINDRAGISQEPGYRQVVTTDSEDNLILFTEYTGKSQ